ncbi:MAG: hypothetical protein WKF30_15720 [Pyrinomonadaceae bacterium]
MDDDNVTVVRYNDRLQATDNKLQELLERYRRISINDSNMWATMALPHARQLQNMLQLARVMTLGALNRNESRGAHYKPDFPNRDDDNFLKTTIAEYSGEGPVLSYEAIDVSLVKPRKRDYSKGKDSEPTKVAPQITSATDSSLRSEAEASGLPVPDGAGQVPLQGWEASKPDTSNAAVWSTNKEQVDQSVFGEAPSRRERGKDIEDAGGKSDKV